ncbi:Nuclear distribution protein PAC1 [Grifola frondosa]|uniref:Nuclear distribution protein PAC1 n=1 Tax=Grifola frondosa TaxID=5627 RepID=A0A1C7LSK0_GRIFR|nr:Nuclear distribution protein PAC1 [Grifola frondosa]
MAAHQISHYNELGRRRLQLHISQFALISNNAFYSAAFLFNGNLIATPRSHDVDALGAAKGGIHKSILEYLHSNNFTDAFNALNADTDLDYSPDPKAKYAGLLEKKWTSVIRLQKKCAYMHNGSREQKRRPSRRALALSPAKRHRGQVLKVAFHPTFNLLASRARMLPSKSGTGRRQRHSIVTCSSDLFIKVWDVQNDWKNIKTFPGHEHTVSSVRFMPGDQHIPSSAYNQRPFRLGAMCSTSDDGRLLASCSNDQTARITDPLTGELKMELRGHDHTIEAVVFAPVSAYAAIRELAAIPVSSGRPAHPLPRVELMGTEHRKNKADRRVSRHRLRDKSIKLWDTQSGQLLRSLAGHDNWVRALVFHPTGKFLLSASDDYTIRVWELTTGRCVKTVQAHGHFVTCLAWGRQAPPGAGNGTAKANGAGADAKAGEVEKFVNVVASGSVDQTIKVWLP